LKAGDSCTGEKPHHISNRTHEDAAMITTIKVKGMSCNHCVMAVTKALRGLNGVTDVKVDLAAGQAVLEHDSVIDLIAVKDLIEQAGYEIG